MTSSRGGSKRTDAALPSCTWIELGPRQCIVHFTEPLDPAQAAQCLRAVRNHEPPMAGVTGVKASDGDLVVSIANDGDHTPLRLLTHLFNPAKRYARVIEVSDELRSVTIEVVGRAPEDFMWALAGAAFAAFDPHGAIEIYVDGRSCIVKFAKHIPEKLRELLSDPEFEPLVQFIL